jgi:uncharacterized protein YndB with AHSA1/START domain
MDTKEKTVVSIEATINAPVEKVWTYWSKPEHITKWNQASDDWHSPRSENDLREGGRFMTRMEAKDGSFGFDFGGVYDAVKKNEYIAYTMDDGRKVKTRFAAEGNKTRIESNFEAEDVHPVEFQKAGWQAILNSFKKYTENN